MSAITLKNYHVAHIVNWLKDVPLHGRDLRSRNRLMQALGVIHNEIETERIKMVEERAEKDENGKPKMEEGHFVLSDEAMEAFKAEYEEYLREDRVVDILESNRDDWQTAKKLILDLKRDMPHGVEALVYEEVCEIVEKI